MFYLLEEMNMSLQIFFKSLISIYIPRILIAGSCYSSIGNFIGSIKLFFFPVGVPFQILSSKTATVPISLYFHFSKL